jgi:hypothetical protein
MISVFPLLFEKKNAWENCGVSILAPKIMKQIL